MDVRPGLARDRTACARRGGLGRSVAHPPATPDPAVALRGGIGGNRSSAGPHRHDPSQVRLTGVTRAPSPLAFLLRINHNTISGRPRCLGATDGRRLPWLPKEVLVVRDWSCSRRTSIGASQRFRRTAVSAEKDWSVAGSDLGFRPGQELRNDPGARRARPDGPERGGARLPRAERRRQDHHHPRPAGAAAQRCRGGHAAGRRSRGGTRSRCTVAWPTCRAR